MKEDSVGAEVVVEGGAAALGAFVPGGFLARPLLGRLVDQIQREYERNTSHALRTASRVSGLSREDLLEFIEENPRGVPLYLLVLHAAGMNGYDETMRAMGAVFGQAAQSAKNDDSRAVDRADAALRAMSNLTPYHFRTLRYLREHPATPNRDGGKNYSTTTPDAVALGLGFPVEDAAQYLLNLAAAGLVTMITGLFGGGTGHEVTPIGDAVCEAAEIIAE